AKELGMTKSHFANSNGWPDSSHLMSMRDLALLADRIISDFPDFYPMFAEKTFLFDGRAKSNTLNRNPLLWLDIGADGLKTGHTKEAGYGIVGSAKQGERRVIFVLSGLDSARDRAKQSEAIV
ncbi:MAG: D-alanyl-D-alanine carboxypeptidase family protein, partial [Rhodobacterales bacterium]